MYLQPLSATSDHVPNQFTEANVFVVAPSLIRGFKTSVGIFYRPTALRSLSELMKNRLCTEGFVTYLITNLFCKYFFLLATGTFQLRLLAVHILTICVDFLCSVQISSNLSENYLFEILKIWQNRTQITILVFLDFQFYGNVAITLVSLFKTFILNRYESVQSF